MRATLVMFWNAYYLCCLITLPETLQLPWLPSAYTFFYDRLMTGVLFTPYRSATVCLLLPNFSFCHLTDGIWYTFAPRWGFNQHTYVSLPLELYLFLRKNNKKTSNEEHARAQSFSKMKIYNNIGRSPQSRM